MKTLYCCRCSAEISPRKFMAAGWLKVTLDLKGGGRATHAVCAECRKTDFSLLDHCGAVHTGKSTCKNWEAA